MQEDQGNVGITRMYVRRQFDRLSYTGTNDKKGAFVRIVDKVVEEFSAAYELGVQEALHGDQRGIKATVVNVVSTTVFDVENPYGYTGAGQGALLINRGSFIAATDSTGATVRGRGTVTALALQTAPDRWRVTSDTALTGITNGDLILSASTADTSFGAYPNGLGNMLNRPGGGNYDILHGINRTTRPRWDSVRLVAGTDVGSAAAIAEGDIVTLFMRIGALSGINPMMKPGEFLLITTPGLKKALVESRQGQVQLTLQQGSVKLDGGYATDYSINNVPVLDDPRCPIGCVMVVHKPSLGWVDALDFSPVAFEGSDEWRFISDRDAFETSNAMYWNLMTDRRCAHGIITGYVDTDRYTHLI
jgi:hypothetical protein